MKKKILSLFLIALTSLTMIFVGGPGVKANGFSLNLSSNRTADRIELYFESGGIAIKIDDDVYDKAWAYSNQLGSDEGLFAYINNYTHDGTNLVIDAGSNSIYLSSNRTADRIELYFESGGIAIKIDDDVYDKAWAYSNQLGSDEGLFAYINNYTHDGTNLVIAASPISGPDNTRPAITGEENFVTNVDDAKPVSFFQQYITAIDETDGVVPVYVITDNYTANMSVLGAHKVVFGAKDNSDNEATLEVYIRVVDITKPIITGSTAVASIGYKETWNISNFKTTLTVSDNYDTLTHNDITVKTDGYTSNKTKLGTYNVVYAVVDNSGNEGTFTKQVKVIDNVKPNISGPTTIATSNNTILTESDVRSQLTASDEIDGNITNKIELVEDNYTGQGNKVGSYTIKYRVIDNAGNVGEHTVTIQRSDKIPPVFFIEDGVTIKTTPTTPLSFEQIIAILEATGQVTVTSQTTFRTLFNDYTGLEEEPGLYTWSISAKSTNGSESVHHMSIQVLDVEEDEDTIDVIPDFDLVDWAKENPIYAGLIAVAAIGLIYIFIKRKLRK